MNSGEFYTIWRKEQGNGKEERYPLCPIATEFLRKLEDTLFSPLEQTRATRSKIAQAKYILQAEYHTWRKSLPALHLRNIKDHHRCLAEVYDAAYDRLHLMELTVRPPINLILEYDEITKPPPPPQIAGIFIGDSDGK